MSVQMQYGNKIRIYNYIPLSSWVGTEKLLSQLSYSHRYPLTKRAGFAFNRIVSSRQFVGCHNKTTKLPAHLRDLPFSKLVGEAETGTLYGLEKVEWNRNSER